MCKSCKAIDKSCVLCVFVNNVSHFNVYLYTLYWFCYIVIFENCYASYNSERYPVERYFIVCQNVHKVDAM